MATSGNFTGSTSNKYISSKIEWSCVQNITGNYSDVTADLYYKKSSSSTSATTGTLKASISINGDKASKDVSSFNIPANNTYQKAMSHTVRVPHNSDGTKSVTISCSGYISGTTLESTTCKSTVELTTIPRASTVIASSADIGSVCKIAIKRASSNFTHTLKYSFENLEGTIVTKTSESNIDWTIPEDFYNQIKNAKNKTGTLTCITYNRDTEIGITTSQFTVTVPETSAPLIDPKVYVPTDSKTYELTGSTTKLIRNYTWASYEINATAQKGASISSQKMTNGDLVYTDPTGTMNKALTASKFLFTAVDSRGYVSTKEYVADIIEYINPSVSVGDARFRSDGSISLSIKGSYFNGSFGQVRNTLTVRYRYAESGNDYGQWETVTATSSGNKYTANVSLTGLNYLSTYKIQAEVTDEIRTVTSKEVALSCIPVFDWGKTGFNFNVPLEIQGETLVDYVVERWIDGIWTCEKWHSGKAVCWGNKNYGSKACTTAAGSLYQTAEMTIDFPDDLFNSAPNYIDMNILSSDYAGFIYRGSEAPDTTSIGKFFILRPTSVTYNGLTIAFRAIGTWK